MKKVFLVFFAVFFGFVSVYAVSSTQFIDCRYSSDGNVRYIISCGESGQVEANYDLIRFYFNSQEFGFRTGNKYVGMTAPSLKNVGKFDDYISSIGEYRYFTSSPICKPEVFYFDYDEGELEFVYKAKNLRKPTDFKSDLNHFELRDVPEELLSKYYFMNADFELFIKNVNTSQEWVLKSFDNVKLKYYEERFELDGVDVSEFKRLREESGDGGVYELRFRIRIDDGKCDGVLTNDYVSQVLESFEVFFSDVDADGISDVDDLCVDVFGLAKFRGCPSEYSLIGECEGGGVRFDGERLVCDVYDCFVCDNDNYFKFAGGRVSRKKQNLRYEPNRGSGRYSCVNEDRKFYFFGSKKVEKFIGSCELRYNALEDCSNSYLSLTVGDSAFLYKYNEILPYEVGDSSIKAQVFCEGFDRFSSFDFDKFSYANPDFLGDEYLDLRRDANGYIYVEDGQHEGKVKCKTLPNGEEFCSLNNKGDSDSVDLNYEKLNAIRIVKDGNFDRYEKIDAKLIGLNSHKIRRFHSGSSLENFVSKSFELMSELDITKDLEFFGDKTKVKIQLENISVLSQRDLVVYQIVPKEVVASLEEIEVLDSGGGEFFVLDKDPVIGWYFNDTGSAEIEIEYEVPGISEGGVIVIAQEPILFNEGNLVVNYREGGCNVGEVSLFELDSLVDSKVFVSGSNKLFKVCLSDVDLSRVLLSGSGKMNVDLFSFENAGLSSEDLMKFSELVNVGIEMDDIYLSYFVQRENPEGDYSCIGSFTNVSSSSLFGDCGNNPELRLWLHLGDDIVAPSTEFEVGVISHVIPITLRARDDVAGSGVKGVYYCEDFEDGCDPVVDGKFVEGEVVKFSITCPDRWGCIKYVRVQAVDNYDNFEEVSSNVVKILDVGNSCDASCLVRPKPNRYVAECNNLNSCNFYDFNADGVYDNGKYVAQLCDMVVVDSYVQFNETHDILCPSGGFRKTKFGGEIDVETNCESVRTFDYPTIIEGESVVMKVLVCLD